MSEEFEFSIKAKSNIAEIIKRYPEGRQKSALLPLLHIAQEETKFGLDQYELENIINNEATSLTHTNIKGLMGMASFSDDIKKIQNEFSGLSAIFEKIKNKVPGCSILSMGMSGDYTIALESGSNMIRIGSLLFGSRD